MNKKYQAEELISKYHQGVASPEERLLVEQWFLIDLEQSHILPSAEAVKKADQKISSNLQAHIQGQAKDKKIYKLWPRIAAAAAVLLIVGLGVFFYTSYYAPRHLEGSAAMRDLLANDIKPGSNKAYLILSNGKRLSLSDAANGAIAKEAGVEITKTADGQVIYSSHPLAPSGRDAAGREGALNTIETPRGGQYQIRLPDGSKVWLNAASKLIYPVSFIGRGQREVTLSGEAYFEVAKDKQHPFKVKSAGQEVEVLGTHFNVSSYPDEANIKTTLLEGSVKVNDAILKPGQQATLQANKIKVTEVNTDYAVAWKDGSFVFNSENLESIMNQISRWYNVSVVYEDPSLKKETFFGTISKYENVSKVLNMLERTDVARFTINGNTIKITKNK